MLFACYRRDDAHDPSVYAAAIAAILEGYPTSIVDRATDPRTGVASECKWLPAVAEVREFCEREHARQIRLSRPILKALPRKEIERKPGQKTYAEFLLMAERGEVKPRPIGFFEQQK